MHNRGSALLSVITLLALLLPLAAHTVLQSHIDLLLARNFRDQTDATYVAEAGLEHALAQLNNVGSLRALLLGPDAIADSADDGEFPIPLRSPGFDGGRDYVIRVAKLDDTKVEVTSTGNGRHGTTRALAALIQAGDSPLTPAALWLAGDERPITLALPELQISGRDASITRPDAAVAPWAFAGSSGPSTSALDVDAIAAQLAALPVALPLAPGPAPQNLGAIASPQLSVVDGDLVVSATTSGAGLLLVRGALQISGVLRFDGLIIVLGAIEASSDSELLLSGAVWQTSRLGPTVISGRGSIRYSSTALDLAEAAAPEVLPHALQVLGRREVS